MPGGFTAARGRRPTHRPRVRPRARAAAFGPEGAPGAAGAERKRGRSLLRLAQPSRSAAAPGTSRGAGRCRPGSSRGPAHPFPRAGLPGRCASRPRACCALGFRHRSRGGEHGGREATFSPAALSLPGSAETQASSARAQGVPASGGGGGAIPASGARARAVGLSQLRAREAEAQARPRPPGPGSGGERGGASGRIS